MKVSITIPLFNQWRYTQSCLESLAADIQAGVPVVLVDNGSTDETAEALRRRTDVRVISNPENRGCAAAWNQGVRALHVDFVVVMNNDVLVTDGWLAGLLAFAKANDAQVVSPAIREGEMTYDLADYSHRYVQRMKHMARWGVASGICFMVHRQVFESIGYFDEQFRVGQFEDADFFLRARRAGFKLAITGAAFIHHFGSTTQRSIYADFSSAPYAAANRAYFRKKWKLGWWRRRWQRLAEAFQRQRWHFRERRLGHSLQEG